MMDPVSELNMLKDMYLNTLVKLQEYSRTPSPIVNIPISNVGFIQGRLVDTSQIIVSISNQFNLTTDLSGSEEIIKKKIEGII